VSQEGDRQFFLHAPGEGSLREATAREDAKNRQRYAFADPVPQLLTHSTVSEMQPGDRVLLPCLFYVRRDVAGPSRLVAECVGP